MSNVKSIVHDPVPMGAVTRACSHAMSAIAIHAYKWFECVAIVSLWFSMLSASAGHMRMTESENVSSRARANVQNSCHVDINAKLSVIQVLVLTLSDVLRR